MPPALHHLTPSLPPADVPGIRKASCLATPRSLELPTPGQRPPNPPATHAPKNASPVTAAEYDASKRLTTQITLRTPTRATTTEEILSSPSPAVPQVSSLESLNHLRIFQAAVTTPLSELRRRLHRRYRPSRTKAKTPAAAPRSPVATHAQLNPAANNAQARARAPEETTTSLTSPQYTPARSNGPHTTQTLSQLVAEMDRKMEEEEPERPALTTPSTVDPALHIKISQTNADSQNTLHPAFTAEYSIPRLSGATLSLRFHAIDLPLRH